ncbi:hypothetical protein V6N11_037741 [Hibiscus sabdariffa]|uniref:Uncharacterized protein n=1 Tax=Hibiscus sabdariffa TaxID=183260 RepID=A0ABR2PEF9_9ROSI
MKQDKLKDRQSQAQFIVTRRYALIKAQEAQSSKDEERTRTGTSKRNYIIAAGGRTAQKRERSGTGKSARATLREASSSFYFEGRCRGMAWSPGERKPKERKAHHPRFHATLLWTLLQELGLNLV